MGPLHVIKAPTWFLYRLFIYIFIHSFIKAIVLEENINQNPRHPLTGAGQVSGLCVAVLQCCSAAVLQCRSAAVLQCGSVPVLQCCSAAVLQCCSVAVLQCGSASVLQCCSAAVLQCCSLVTYHYMRCVTLPTADTVVSTLITRGETSRFICSYGVLILSDNYPLSQF